MSLYVVIIWKHNPVKPPSPVYVVKKGIKWHTPPIPTSLLYHIEAKLSIFFWVFTGFYWYYCGFLFLQRDDRIEALFLTCFIALMIYRILEKQLKEENTCDELITTLRKMNMRKIDGHGYIPCYKRTDITDALHKNAGFHTDYELLTSKTMAGIIRRSKGL